MFVPPSCLTLIVNNEYYSYYRLKSTPYIMVYDNFYNKKRNWCDSELDPVSSETVFEEASDEQKESLIFYLDLFLD